MVLRVFLVLVALAGVYVVFDTVRLASARGGAMESPFTLGTEENPP